MKILEWRLGRELISGRRFFALLAVLTLFFDSRRLWGGSYRYPRSTCGRGSARTYGHSHERGRRAGYGCREELARANGYAGRTDSHAGTHGRAGIGPQAQASGPWTTPQPSRR